MSGNETTGRPWEGAPNSDENMTDPRDSVEQRRKRARRTAIIMALVAVAFYVAFFLTRGH